MDIKKAALDTASKLDGFKDVFGVSESLNVDHLKYMEAQIDCGDVEGEKAHRWLGWLQACVCSLGLATLEELKQINHEA